MSKYERVDPEKIPSGDLGQVKTLFVIFCQFQHNSFFAVVYKMFIKNLHTAFVS
jgi:hypothetical protein